MSKGIEPVINSHYELDLAALFEHSVERTKRRMLDSPMKIPMEIGDAEEADAEFTEVYKEKDGYLLRSGGEENSPIMLSTIPEDEDSEGAGHGNKCVVMDVGQYVHLVPRGHWHQFFILTKEEFNCCVKLDE